MFSLSEKIAPNDGTICNTSREFCDGENLPVMVVLSAGEFLMGENEGDKFANDTERPPHAVKLAKPFALGKFPVTVGEFRKFRQGHASEDADDFPVVHVNWHDAVAYCQWVARQTGREYRLASEAEWEFACRGGSRSPFSCGEEISTSNANFLYDETGMSVGKGGRTPVGSFLENPFGLHDMHGNVCEWVMDCWHENYFGAPVDGSARFSPDDSRRLIRGGAWDYMPRLLRSSWRDWRLAHQCTDNIGFRIATNDLREPA